MTRTSTLQNSAGQQTAHADESAGDVCRMLRRVAGTVTSRQEMYREALSVLARHFDAPYAAWIIDTQSGTMRHRACHGEAADASWRALCDGLMLDAQYRNLPVARLYDSPALETRFAVLAVPIVEDARGTVGALVVVTEAASKAVAAALLAELHALVSLVADRPVSPRTGVAEEKPGSTPAHAAVARVGAYSSVHDLAFALANGLKSKLGCEQVSLGLVRGNTVRVLCISGLDDLYPRSPGARLIHQAMEECLDAETNVAYQNQGGAEPAFSTGHMLHKQWHDQTGNSCVVSLPLRVDGQYVAVLSLRNPASRPFSSGDLERIEQTVAPLVPGLVLSERANRRLLEHAVDVMREMAGNWLRPGAWGRKIVLAGFLLLAAWLVFGTTNFVVTLPCKIVPVKVHQIAAPFEGTIAAAHVQAGDSVRAGQLLVEMDTRELILQEERLLAEKRIAELDLTRALDARDHAAAAQAESRIEVAGAQLQTVRSRIERSQIRALEDGVVLAGELAPRVGEVVPLGEPLLEFAPQGAWEVEAHIPEYAAPYLQQGQIGQFTTSALPDRAHACTVRRVEVLSEVIDGKNVFVAQAAVDNRPPWVRIGMTGVAKIHAGIRPVWWVALHRIIDGVRLQIWRL